MNYNALWIIVYFLLTAVYSYWVLGFIIGLFALRSGRSCRQYKVSVIIPARNEEEGIIGCLASVLHQDYPADLFEVIVVDDRSADRTPGIVKEFREEYPDRVRLVRIGMEEKVISGKKQALTRGIEAASGEIIFVVDGDCRVLPGWISGLLRYFEPDVGVVCGATFSRRRNERGILHKLESAEVVSLIAAGAGSIGLGRPIICNGSNLAYRKEVFESVGGFTGIDKLASGDDDMFIQKVGRDTGWKVAFAADPGTFSRTRPAASWRTFFNQRIRWSSKGAYYPDKWLVFHLLETWLLYIFSIAVAVYLIIHPAAGWYLIFPLFSKFMVEAVLLVRGCVLFRRPDLIWWAPVFGLVYMPYVLMVSTLGFFKKFTWK